MTGEPAIPEPPEELPAEIGEVLLDHATNVKELQETIIYAQELLNVQQESALPIEPKEGEEIRRVEQRPEYIEVVKRFEGEDGAYLYHVHPEQYPDGEERLHWSLIGRVKSEG